ncbi:MAG: hypothetical protein HY000_11415 [Planctomycetes bacterium]|nr:hypothetical protein [Planctomycetota bacterium]
MLPLLADPDRFVRYAGRLLMQCIDARFWENAVLASADANVVIEGLIALQTVSPKHDLHRRVAKAVETLKAVSPSSDEFRRALRVAQLLVLAGDDPSHAAFEQLGMLLAARFPTGATATDWEIARLLAVLQVAATPERLVSALYAPTADRPTQIHYALCLRHVTTGWTPQLRRKYLEWFEGEHRWEGGYSFAMYVQNILRDAAAAASTPERKQLVRALGPRAPLVVTALIRSFTNGELSDLTDELLQLHGGCWGEFNSAGGASASAADREDRTLLSDLWLSEFQRSAPPGRRMMQSLHVAVLAVVSVSTVVRSSARAELELQRQFVSLQDDLRNRARLVERADQTFRAAALVLDSDRDPAEVVLRRTGALLDDLKRLSGASRFEALQAELQSLRARSQRLSLDARIIWTRWDYVDRHGCTAHMPWITSLDGADPRPVHGNYAPRPTRPDMELHVRAIPGSPRFVATAAPHHGQAFGSLVIIDPRMPDDDGMAPVKRLTPEVDFPESQRGAQVYGTAWPLGDDYYLCVYDGNRQQAPGSQGEKYVRGDYGIYLIDSFGNKELIYRDAEIACLHPIPLRPRQKPSAAPVVASIDALRSNPATRDIAPLTSRSEEATVAVINVYDSQYPWPPNTAIKALRVLQLLPMTVPSGKPPHETGSRFPEARDSVVPARAVLGTVPVEADGSAHFQVPAYKEIFFQALDERGRAVQSMRSATHTRAGERLVCHGCHAGSSQTPHVPSQTPLALRRPPSRLQPDVDGSDPFSYPRLVQPVLDRHCVSCHAQRGGEALNLGIEPIQQKWYASYNSLIQYGFTTYNHAYRTTPGQFGARASKLTEILDRGHYGVNLSEEEMHRITLWLDCLSMFYGVYEKDGGEAQLRGEIVRPTLE